MKTKIQILLSLVLVATVVTFSSSTRTDATSIGQDITTNGSLTVAGASTFNSLSSWDSGGTISATSYQIGRDLDATNQLHFNVPTGASMEWSINDSNKLKLRSDGGLELGGASSTSKLNIESAPTATSGLNMNIRGFTNVSNPGVSSGSYYGSYNTVFTTGVAGNITGQVAGQANLVNINKAGMTFGEATGTYSEIAMNAGTATTAFGNRVMYLFNGGTIGTMIGSDIAAMTGSSTVTTAIASRIAMPTIGATNWGLQITGVGNSYVEGSLALGKASAPAATLDIDGSAIISDTYTSSDSLYLIRNVLTYAPTENNANYFAAQSSAISITGGTATSLTGQATGYGGVAELVTSGMTVSVVSGVEGDASVSQGTATELSGLRGAVAFAGSGIATKAASIHAFPATVTSGTAGTTYALWLEPVGAGSTEWVLGVDGSSKNSYIAGSLRIGSSVAPTEILDVTGNIKLSGVLNASTSGIKTKHSTADVSTPPTDADLDGIFGTAAAVGSGFVATLDDNGAGTNSYTIWSDGTNWWFSSGTKAM